MKKLTHKQKLKLARRMSRKQSGAFKSDEWQERKLQIRLRVIRHDYPGRLEAIGL